MGCGLCLEDMRKAYTYPAPRKTRCKHEVVRDRKRDFESFYFSKVRKANGHQFRPSRQSKKLWKQVLIAKQKRSLISRGRAWINQLGLDANSGEGMAKSLRGDLKVARMRLHKGAPALEFKAEKTYRSIDYTLFGTYSHSQNCIEIHNTHDGLDQMRDTLVHEALHFMDALALIPGGHGRFWKTRLAQMFTWFPKSIEEKRRK